MRTVTAPDGTVHTVRIEWIGNALRRSPVKLRRRVRRMADAADVADVGCVPDLGELFVGIFAVVFLIVVAVFVLPVAWGLVEILLVVVLAALVWAGRVLFRRPWSIVQRGVADIEEDRWQVVGWRAAHRRMVTAAAAIEASGTARAPRPAAGQD